MYSKTLKKEALLSLKGKWGIAIVVSLLYEFLFDIFYYLDVFMPDGLRLISWGSSYTLSSFIQIENNIFIDMDLIDLVWTLGTWGGFLMGWSKCMLSISRDGSISIGQLFFYFTSIKRFVTGFVLNILFFIYLGLWTLLLIVPGIIKYYSYAMTPYILIDEPERSVNDAITKSKTMMRGYKTDLFALHVSFLGWILVFFFTGLIYGVVEEFYHFSLSPTVEDVMLLFGVALLTAYIGATEAKFYLKLKNKFEGNITDILSSELISDTNTN